jgi:hypothetical protein
MKTRNLIPVCGLILLIQSSCSKMEHSDANVDKVNSSELENVQALATPVRIEAESYSNQSGVQIEDCREGGKNVGYITKGDWMEYTVNVSSSGSQEVKFRVAGPAGTLNVTKPDGTVLGTVAFPGTSSGQVYTTAAGTVNLTAGQQKLRVYAQSAGWNFNWFELAGGSAAIVVPTPVPVAPTASTGANLILESTFEDNSSFNKWIKEICRPDALMISTQTARKGSGSAKFDFKKSDVTNYNGYVRAEIRQGSQTEAEQWFGFSNFLPSDFVTDQLAEKIAQWHEVPDWDLGENWRSPPIALGIENGRYYLNYMWAAAAVNTNNSKDGEKKVDLGAVDKNTWNDWVFHIKFSYKSDGVLEIWKNKQKVFTLNGPNSFNDKNFPYFKIGIYKWGWNGWASYSPESQRTLYYDEVRIGNKNSNLNEVSPK